MELAVWSVMGISWGEGPAKEGFYFGPPGEAQPDRTGVGRHVQVELEEGAAAPLEADEIGSQAERVIVCWQAQRAAVGQVHHLQHGSAQALEGGSLLLTFGGRQGVEVTGNLRGGGRVGRQERGAGHGAAMSFLVTGGQPEPPP